MTPDWPAIIRERWPQMEPSLAVHADATANQITDRLRGTLSGWCTDWDAINFDWLYAKMYQQYETDDAVPDPFLLFAQYERGATRSLCVLMRAGARRFWFRRVAGSDFGNQSPPDAPTTDDELRAALGEWETGTGNVIRHLNQDRARRRPT